MFSSFQKISLLLALLLFAGLFSGCGTFRRMNLPSTSERDSIDAQDLGLSRLRPKSYAIYPFRNTSNYEDAAIRARREIAGQFALLGELKPLAETDKRVADVSTFADVIKVGREMGAEAVVMGQVTAEDHMWLFFYSGSTADVSLSVYSTQDGRCLWRGSSWASDFIVNPLVFPTIFHNIGRERHTADMYHRIGADMVNRINPSVYSNQIPKVKK